MLKKVIALLLTCVTIGSTAIPICAANLQYASPYYLYTIDASSTLIISENTASCESYLTGYRGTTTKVAATQYLEKKSGMTWKKVSGGTWSDTQNGSTFSLYNSKSNLESGTYHVRTVFTVYSGTKSETVEKTSKEVTI